MVPNSTERPIVIFYKKYGQDLFHWMAMLLMRLDRKEEADGWPAYTKLARVLVRACAHVCMCAHMRTCICTCLLHIHTRTCTDTQRVPLRLCAHANTHTYAQTRRRADTDTDGRTDGWTTVGWTDGLKDR